MKKQHFLQDNLDKKRFTDEILDNKNNTHATTQTQTRSSLADFSFHIRSPLSEVSVHTAASHCPVPYC
jgi:hypothetical protein